MKQNGLWRLFTACLACVVVSWNGSVSAEDDVREAGGTAEPITVAVLGFDAGDGPEGGLSQMLAELLGVMLEEHSSFEMVDRADLQRVTAEQSLNLSGLVESEDAIQVGRMVGAEVLVVGRAMELGGSRFFTAKAIGTETTRTASAMVRGARDQSTDALILQLAEEFSEKLKAEGPSLLASDKPADPLPGLIAALSGRALPIVAVSIPEEDLARATALSTRAGVPDPAAETEIKTLLRAAGFTVRDLAGNELASGLQEQADWPDSLDGVDVVVIGEAFSDTGGALGGLRSAVGRLEVNAIEREDGVIVWVGRTTQRAVDVSTAIAGKSALEKTGRALGIELLQYFDESLPAEADYASETVSP